MLRLMFFLIGLFSWSGLGAQTRLRVVSWNVENLFDCKDDSLKQDEEFLPESQRGWTPNRYWRKLEDISRVIMGIGGGAPPALVGLCEVENDSVMYDLVKRTPLRALGYDYVMSDGSDERGIDVALMYSPLFFRLLGSTCHRVPSVEAGLRPTRDILHVWGQVLGCDTLHVVVCHLPSRAGDSKEGKRNRSLAVHTLCSLTDSLLSVHPQCQLLVMGDFNATLRDRQLKPLSARQTLCPLTPHKRCPTSGTYRYQGNWSWIDHFFVSEALLVRHGATGNACMAQLYSQPWMQRPMSDGTWYPRRTYLGTVYAGGVSDHVPIFVDFFW